MIDLDTIRQRHEERMRNSIAAAMVHQPTAQVCADVDALLAEVERLRGGWIKIEDQMPPDGDDTLYNVVVEGQVMSCWYFPPQGSWETSDGKLYQDNARERVTHWRPLPDLP